MGEIEVYSKYRKISQSDSCFFLSFSSSPAAEEMLERTIESLERSFHPSHYLIIQVLHIEIKLGGWQITSRPVMD